MREKAKTLLAGKQADSVLGWQSGQFYYDNTPTFFDSAEQAESLVWNGFCGGNLSKNLIDAGKKGKKTAAFLKPCETLSVNQMLKDNQISKENVVIIGVGCAGMFDVNKLKAQGIKGILEIEEGESLLTVKTLYGDNQVDKKDILLEKCLACKNSEHAVYDELLGETPESFKPEYDRFLEVAEIEAMSASEKFDFWQSHLSKCIRCNACRNTCPACSCVQCIFDDKNSGMDSKANSDSFEEQLFHIVRAYHVAGRCSDCGECSRVCPQNIPLHLINRKFIKDINKYYGDYQAGADVDEKAPLLTFKLDDFEPTLTAKAKGRR
jgi:Na+-translocating ferredoxin:NAD+ oxidoreductase RnfC subunit